MKKVWLWSLANAVFLRYNAYDDKYYVGRILPLPWPSLTLPEHITSHINVHVMTLWGDGPRASQRRRTHALGRGERIDAQDHPPLCLHSAQPCPILLHCFARQVAPEHARKQAARICSTASRRSQAPHAYRRRSICTLEAPRLRPSSEVHQPYPAWPQPSWGPQRCPCLLPAPTSPIHPSPLPPPLALLLHRWYRRPLHRRRCTRVQVACVRRRVRDQDDGGRDARCSSLDGARPCTR
ncbi:hypothetical protein PENSPDRAFT_58558 [Peniophora sp. CONT]|nr:hypothetical protein PENSPDRAFT_58558 [Peniophora sp. CONT]